MLLCDEFDWLGQWPCAVCLLVNAMIANRMDEQDGSDFAANRRVTLGDKDFVATE